MRQDCDVLAEQGHSTCNVGEGMRSLHPRSTSSKPTSSSIVPINSLRLLRRLQQHERSLREGNIASILSYAHCAAMFDCMKCICRAFMTLDRADSLHTCSYMYAWHDDFRSFVVLSCGFYFFYFLFPYRPYCVSLLHYPSIFYLAHRTIP